MYSAELSREEQREGRTFSFYKVNRDDDGRFVGCIVRVIAPTEKGNVEHWYVDAEMDNPKAHPCRDAETCFKRVLKSWKKRGGSLAK